MKRNKFLITFIIILMIALILIVFGRYKDTVNKETIYPPPIQTQQEETETEEPTQPVIIQENKIQNSFYQIIADSITKEEKETIARLVFLEARNQSFLGQKAVVEVVFNRMLSSEFPNSVNEVIYQENQFSPAKYISSTTPSKEQYEVVDEVLSEIYPVLDSGVVFFSTKQYNDYLYEKIGDHYFCYSKNSYESRKEIRNEQ